MRPSPFTQFATVRPNAEPYRTASVAANKAWMEVRRYAIVVSGEIGSSSRWGRGAKRKAGKESRNHRRLVSLEP